MTDYKTIFGKKIKFQTTDLTMSTATEGELFYSDTDSEFKVGATIGAWASGGNMNNADSFGAGAPPVDTKAVCVPVPEAPFFAVG